MREQREARRLFEDAVEATRLGTIFASDRKALAKWRRATDQPVTGRALSDEELERRIGAIGSMFPGHVTREVA